MTEPLIASRDCDHCQAYLYNEETGEVETLKATGEPLPRYDACPPPCRDERGCPKGTPENPLSLSDKNHRALRHFQRCRAVGKFPNDSQVEENARIIDSVERSIRESRECLTHELLKRSIARGL